MAGPDHGPTTPPLLLPYLLHEPGVLLNRLALNEIGQLVQLPEP
jgi:hypothetical protein